MTAFTIEQQIAEVRRELGMRRKVYPRFVAGGRITSEQAAERIARLEAVQSTLEQLRDEQNERTAPGLFPKVAP